MIKRVMATALVLTLAATWAMAGAAVGVKIGTLGLGAEATLGVSENTNLRLGVNGASVDLSSLIEEASEELDSGIDTEDIQLDLELSTVAALLDWHCFGGSFRLTGGAMLNNNEATLSADANDSLNIGDSTYTVAALDGAVTFGDVAPYLGLGFGNAVDEDGRLSFAFEVGILFQGSPEVELTATSSNPALQNQLNADLEKEAQTIEDDTEDITMYPVVSLGFAYRF